MLFSEWWASLQQERRISFCILVFQYFHILRIHTEEPFFGKLGTVVVFKFCNLTVLSDLTIIVIEHSVTFR